MPIDSVRRLVRLRADGRRRSVRCWQHWDFVSIAPDASRPRPSVHLRPVMADTLTPGQRSERMSRIRGRDTKPEILVRRCLHASGLRFRLRQADLPGRPDIVLAKYQSVVFVHGCFWHAHRCQKGRVPATRTEFWRAKFEQNRRRDEQSVRALRKAGWHVFTVWECELSNQVKRDKALDRLVRKIRKLRATRNSLNVTHSI